MHTAIDTLTKRKKLTARREPYWHKLGKGRFLGFRKTKDEHGTWTARSQKGQNKKYKKLGSENELTFEGASSKALNWFKSNPFDNQPVKVDYTIRMAVDDYISHLRIHNSEDSANRTKNQLYKHLIPKLGETYLSDLKTIELKKWRDSLLDPIDDCGKILAKSTVNRILTSVKASFNLALEDGHIQSDSAWKKVTAFPGADDNRKLFLSDKQVNLLLKLSSGDLLALIKTHLLTGTRPGELTKTTASHFDQNAGTLFIIDGKTGPRLIYLQDAAIKFISKITQNKSKKELIFTDNNTKWTRKCWAEQLKEVVIDNSTLKEIDKDLSPADIEDMTLPAETIMYSLRHYHISKALLAGLPLQLVAENCGTSVKMIEKHYGKFTPNDRREMFNKVSLIST
ncbi:MAG: hypothetical protein COB22_08370 [Cycloclasticus sp.]|nr:MAG: hypothetical protein COB22_08370 [Cycloclasticus sp.]